MSSIELAHAAVPRSTAKTARVRIAELWNARTLMTRFLLQDLTIKYHRSFFGFLWSLLSPLLMLGVIATAFSFAFRSREGDSYVLHLVATLLPWFAFSNAFTDSSVSLLGFERLLKQFYFPKLLFPLRRVLFRMAEGLLSLFALLLVAPLLGFTPSLALLILPLAVLNLFLFALGLGTLGSIVVVYVRDSQHLIAVVTRAWFYATPIIVPFSRLPESLQTWFALNPLYYHLELFDAPITRGAWPSFEAIVISTGCAVASLLFSIAIFFRYEDDVLFHL